MAKSTQKKALETEKCIQQAIVDIFMEKGWEAISYGSIAKHTGLSRGGVQRIVPNKDAMLATFEGHVTDVFTKQLDFSSELSLMDSWLISLENLQFRNCLKFFICAISNDSLGKASAKKIFDGLSEKIGQDKMQSLIGLAVYQLLET